MEADSGSEVAEPAPVTTVPRCDGRGGFAGIVLSVIDLCGCRFIAVDRHGNGGCAFSA
jgi:hypothetical protein